MTNRKTTRRALFMSIISLMLCCAMLVGTTFAWFTDEVTSVNNVITAGNLDVELYYKNGANSSYAAVGSEPLFSSSLWEPGHVEMVNLKVSNLGTLALKYQLNVSVINEKGGINKAGDDFLLSDYIRYAVLDGDNYATREAAVAAAGQGTAVNGLNWTKSNSILANGADQVVTLVVWMPETVGNEANYKTGTDVPTINLGVNLYATQKDAESDSFGPDYDEDAHHKSFKVTTADELQAAIDAGETNIALVTDIDLADGEKIVVEAGKTVTINLNGKTVSGAVNKGAGAVLENKGTLTVKGGTIENTAVNGGPAISNSGNLTLEGANVVGAPIDGNDGYPSYALNTSGKLTIEEGTSVSSDRGAIQILGDGETTINGGVFTNNDISRSVTSHVVDLSDDAVNHVLTINGGTFQHLFDETSGGVVICNRTKNTIYVNGGSFSGGNYYGNDNLCDYGYGGTFSVTGGTYTAKPAEKYIASGYKAVDNQNGTWSVKAEGTELVTEGLYKKDNTYYIESANGLKYFSAKVLTGNNGTAETAVIELQADIDLAGADFSSIVAQRGDTLTINGNGHTISNVNIISGADDNTTGQAGMFYCYNDSTLNISDLILKDIVVTAEESDSGYAAAVVGYCEGAAVLNNVDVVNATINGEKSSGMLAGHVGNGGSLTATGCDVSGTVTLFESSNEPAGHYAGKYVGTIEDPVVLNNCTANVTVGGKLHTNNVGDVYGRMTSAGSLTIDGTAQKAASTQDALNAAVSTTGNVDITLAAGEYKMPSSTTTGEVSISGTKDTVLDATLGAYMDSADGVTIEGVTIKTSTGMVNGNGSDYAALYAKDVTYINCTFVGPMRVGRDGAKFINCTFTDLGNDYVWTYGNDVTFEGCTFNTAGKAILIYSDGGNEVSQVSVKNCTFNATQGAKAGAIANQNCAAIEIHNYGNGVNLTTSGNTYDSNFSGEWRIKTYETGKPKIFVNGTEYTTIAIDGKTMTKDASNNVTVNS